MKAEIALLPRHEAPVAQWTSVLDLKKIQRLWVRVPPGVEFVLLTNIPNRCFGLTFTSLARCECMSQAISWKCETRKVILIPLVPVRVRCFCIYCINSKTTVYNAFVPLENIKV